MSKQLPLNPNLENLKKQAKTLRKEIQQNKWASARLRRKYQEFFAQKEPSQITLRDAQHILANEYGFANWQELAATVSAKRKRYENMIARARERGDKMSIEMLQAFANKTTQSAQPRNMFSNNVKQVMQISREEAQRLNHNYIGTEHLLLGIICHKECSGHETLLACNISLDALKTDLENRTRQNAKSQVHQIPFTPRAKRILEMAVQEAKEFNTTEIKTCHVLLALAKDPDAIASQSLAHQNMHYDQIKLIVSTKFAE